MTELKPKTYRLLARFVFYDPDHGSHLWMEWPAGAIVDDPGDIALLEARGAPVERIRPETFNLTPTHPASLRS